MSSANKFRERRTVQCLKITIFFEENLSSLISFVFMKRLRPTFSCYEFLIHMRTFSDKKKRRIKAYVQKLTMKKENSYILILKSAVLSKCILRKVKKA